MLNRISVVQRMASTFTNRLAHEKSPYLLQHKNNPINWYPWGSEAFEEANAKNCPIFLSVGYSTCHWCHVMEKESFENAATAKYLNDHFISIKVDREERPDVDKLYMAFVVAITGHGGWPMSVFLTPKMAPITGGTYFPPDDNRGMLGFPSILKMIHEEWEKNHENLIKQGSTLLKLLQPETSTGDVSDSKEIFNSILKYKQKTFDSKHGGFGNAPKFPKASDLDFLIAYAANDPDSDGGKDCVNMLKTTLGAMSLGGIHDHIGKGFHRYSVDAEWHVPHFEKMLYDQAQLLATYSDFHRLCQQENKEIEKTIRDIFEYLEEGLSHKDGGFYAAEDADSLPLFDSTKKVEGAFCVWEKEEVKKIIEENSELPAKSFELLCEYFDIEDGGNVAKSSDPHGELTNKNVLRRLLTNNECSINFETSIDELEQRIEKMKQLLSENRKKRPPPHLDSKIVTAWQGLAITGLVKGYQAVGDEKMLKRAEKCVEFVEKWLRNQENGELRRAVYRGENGEIEKGSEKLKAFSDDYAFYIQGLLDFYSVDGNDEILKKAIELQEIMNKKFMGPSGYFISEEDCGQNGVAVRMIEDQDGAEPTATSIGSMNLLRLYDILEKEEYREKANQCFKGAAEKLNKIPFVLPKTAIAHNKWQNGSITVVLVGEKESDLIVRARQILNQKFLINLSVVFIDSEESVAASHGKSHEEMAKGIKPAVYICKGFVCDRPIRDVEKLEEKLSEL